MGTVVVNAEDEEDEDGFVVEEENDELDGVGNAGSSSTTMKWDDEEALSSIPNSFCMVLLRGIGILEKCEEDSGVSCWSGLKSVPCHGDDLAALYE